VEDLKTLNVLEGTEQYVAEISNRFEVLHSEVDTFNNIALETNRENISFHPSVCYYNLKKRKAWFDEGH
jgi:hypothetical protein